MKSETWLYADSRRQSCKNHDRDRKIQTALEEQCLRHDI